MKILSQCKINNFSVKKEGFTLLEMLLVIAIIAILASIVIIAINPAKQLSDTRNAHRRVDVNTISNAIYQYAIDNGKIPDAIPYYPTCNYASNEICRTNAYGCVGLVDLSTITNFEKYIVSVPIDPQVNSVNGTNYFVSKDSYGRVIVCAPNAENNATISITR